MMLIALWLITIHGGLQVLFWWHELMRAIFWVGELQNIRPLETNLAQVG